MLKVSTANLQQLRKNIQTKHSIGSLSEDGQEDELSHAKLRLKWDEEKFGILQSQNPKG